VIDDKPYKMMKKYGVSYAQGVVYTYKTRLSAGTHEYYIKASDSPESVVLTDVYEIKVMQNIMTLLLLLILTAIAVVVILILYFKYFRHISVRKPKIVVPEKKEKVKVEKIMPQIPTPPPVPPKIAVKPEKPEKPGKKPPAALPRAEKPLLLKVEEKEEKTADK
jgi:hypothetical protein